MMNHFKKIYHYIKKTLRQLTHEEVKFRLLIAFEFVCIPILTLCFLILLLSFVLRLDAIHLGVEESAHTFYDYVLSKAIDIVPYVGFYFIVLTFMGFWVSHILLRPFRMLGNYCEDWIADKKPSYDPDFFSDLKLLTSFCEYFFLSINKIVEMKNPTMVDRVDIPFRYTRIHRPIFEFSFFIQNMLLILATSICVAIAMIFFAENVHEHLSIFAQNYLKNASGVHQLFLEKHEDIWNDITFMVVIFHIVANFLLANHLYKKVAIPAFSIFSTFRSFLKGNYNMRVHLVGHYYIREQSRKINKYLNVVEAKIVKNSGDIEKKL